MEEVDRIADELSDDSQDLKPNELVERMIDELRDSINDGSKLADRRAKAHALRLCQWDGQSEDGRKHAADLKKDAHPFEGAPDTQVHLVDEIINEDVVVLFSAFFFGQIQAKANTFAGLDASSHVSVFSTWLRDDALLVQLIQEVELLANIQQGDDPGLAVLGVFWDPDPYVIRSKLSVEALITLAAQNDLPLTHEVMLEAGSENRRAILRQVLPDILTDDALAAALDQFDAEPEENELELVYQGEAGLPRFQALRPGVDVWYDFNSSDIQDTRGIFMPEELTKLELKSRIKSHGYDADWVEAVLKAGSNMRASEHADTEVMAVDETEGDTSREHLYEIWRCWRKEFNELAGAPELRQTVFSYFVPDMLGLDEESSSTRGKYSFVVFRRETIDKSQKSSRGVSRIAGTHQNAIKTLLDCRNVEIGRAHV